MPSLKLVIFSFNNSTDTIVLSIKYLLQQKDNLKLIIKNECNNKLNMKLFEENIILYNVENDTLINTVQDLIENKIKKCKIIVKPIHY